MAGGVLFTLAPVSGTGTGFASSSIKETFAKLSGTAIICSDSQSVKLDFPVDSRLRGNDGRFCKGLHQGRGGWRLVLSFMFDHGQVMVL